MYEYIYVIIIFALLFLFAYIKIRYPFWNMQPVFHSYDYWRYFARTPFQIQYGKSLKTKYTTPKTVKTYSFLDISEKQLAQFVDLLQCHYISSEHILTMVDKQTIQTYLTGQGQSSYVSFFQEDSYTAINCQDPSSISILDILATPTLIGCISSRPVRLFIWDQSNVIHDKMAYYWDHLCVHREFQTKNLGRNLIQTLEYTTWEKSGHSHFHFQKRTDIMRRYCAISQIQSIDVLFAQCANTAPSSSFHGCANILGKYGHFVGLFIWDFASTINWWK